MKGFLCSGFCGLIWEILKFVTICKEVRPVWKKENKPVETGSVFSNSFLQAGFRWPATTVIVHRIGGRDLIGW